MGSTSVFSKYGVNISRALMNAAKNGISPMESALDTIGRIQANEAKRLHLTNPAMREQSDTQILNHLLRSQEAARFASAMLHNKPEYLHLKQIAHGVSKNMIGEDFREAMRDLNG